MSTANVIVFLSSLVSPSLNNLFEIIDGQRLDGLHDLKLIETFMLVSQKIRKRN